MLQAGRGVASLFVVLFHATVIVESPKYWNSLAFNGAFLFGNSGVDFFFVLSGFIILHAHRLDVGHSARLWRYMWKRFVRVYPLYWLVTLIVGLLLVVTHNPHAVLIANSFALIGTRPDAVLVVAWTLFHEILFYLLFALVLVVPRVGMFVMLIWWTACLVFVRTPEPIYVLSPINLLFGFGIAAQVATRRWTIPGFVLPLGVAAYGALAFCVVTGRAPPMPMQHLGFGAAAALIVCGAVSLERAKGTKPPMLLSRLGDASYALYLIHYPLLSLCAKLWMRLSFLRAAPAELAFTVMVIVCVAAGWGLHIAVEKPLSRWLATRGSGQPRTAS